VARIRTIKPEFWSSEQVMASRPLARLLFIGIWNFCDDGGNHPLAPRTIKALVFPGDDITTEEVSMLLGELEGAGLTQSYVVDGKHYLHVMGWKHQKIEKKNFKYPSPPPPVAEQLPTDRPPVGDESSNGRLPVDPVRDVDVDVEGNGINQHNSQRADAPGFVPQVQTPLAGVGPPSSLETAEREPVDSNAASGMTLEWVPDQQLLKAYALRMGLPLSAFTDEAMGPFTVHYEANGMFNTQKEWVSLLVKWVKGDRAKASNVRPFPKASTIARHTLEPGRDYTAGTKGKGDGTFSL
jgi:hypothetical protein